MPKIRSLKEAQKHFLVFGQPDISDEEIQAVTEVLKSGWIGTGKVSHQLEAEFVSYMGGGYALAVSSCSIGLTIALRSVGICHGDYVLTTPLTFCATVNAILTAGARPLFSDVDERGCLDPDIINFDGLRKEASAIVPVHYTGASCEMVSLMSEAARVGLPVIEDAAHSFGGSYFYRQQGAFGDLSVFSFYATKNITGAEGGIIWSRNKLAIDRCKMLSQNGQSSGAWKRYSMGPIENYHVVQPGFKGNMSDVLAAIALIQLRRWPEMQKRRNKVWKVYEAAFGPKEVGHSQHLYTIRCKDRTAFREFMFERGIGTGIHYEALHLEPAYTFLGFRRGDFPNAELISSQTVSLPVSNRMTESDALRVVKAVEDFKRETGRI